MGATDNELLETQYYECCVVDLYNYHRLHGALAGQTPYERLLAKARAGASPGVLRLTNCAVARRPPSDLQKESRGCDVLINCEAAR